MSKQTEEIIDLVVKQIESGGDLRATLNVALTEIGTQAEMLDALFNQQRIRVVGQAGVGEEKYQHLSIEMWTRHLGVEEEKVKAETAFARGMLNTYLSTHASAIRKRNNDKDE